MNWFSCNRNRTTIDYMYFIFLKMLKIKNNIWLFLQVIHQVKPIRVESKASLPKFDLWKMQQEIGEVNRSWLNIAYFSRAIDTISNSTLGLFQLHLRHFYVYIPLHFLEHWVFISNVYKSYKQYMIKFN